MITGKAKKRSKKELEAQLEEMEMELALYRAIVQGTKGVVSLTDNFMAWDDLFRIAFILRDES